jgi:hypothetical protein
MSRLRRGSFSSGLKDVPTDGRLHTQLDEITRIDEIAVHLIKKSRVLSIRAGAIRFRGGGTES